MIRSGDVDVWTLAWRDLDAEAAPPLNPLSETSLGAAKVGPLARVLAHPSFAPLADAVKSVQGDSTLTALRRHLDGETAQDVAARSVLIRGLVAMGRPFEQLPRAVALSDEARAFLQTPGLTEHVGASALDLYLACEKIAPNAWLETHQDLRIVLKATLPQPGETPAAKAAYTDAWRGLWRLVNMLQCLRGFHVEIEGLDTLSPPDMTTQTDAADGGAAARAWAEARALCDEAFHPVIDALIAAETPAPDRIGDDLVAGGRVVGMMEFGWSEAGVAVAETAYSGLDWTLITFDPDKDPVGETVTRILQALEAAKS
jgi:DEAD/DEAH box helicase domain-containing protein